MTLPTVRLLELLAHPDPDLVSWALDVAARVVEPRLWVPLALTAAHREPDLAYEVYQHVVGAPWDIARGPVRALFESPTAEEYVQGMAWMVWAEHEDDVPQPPLGDSWPDVFPSPPAPRAERRFFVMVGEDDEVEAIDSAPPLALQPLDAALADAIAHDVEPRVAAVVPRLTAASDLQERATAALGEPALPYILEALQADHGWAATWLLDNAEAARRQLEDDGGFWRAVARVADLALLPLAVEAAAPGSPASFTAWALELLHRSEPGVAHARWAQGEILHDDDVLVRVVCACGVAEDHVLPVVSLGVSAEAVMIVPHGALVCPACGAVDTWTATHRTRAELTQRFLAARDADVDLFAARRGVRVLPLALVEAGVTRYTPDRERLQAGAASGEPASIGVWLRFLWALDDPAVEAEATAALETDAAPVGHWLLALAAERRGEDALVHAWAALRGRQDGDLVSDVIGMLVDHADVEALAVRWRHEGRVLPGVLDLHDGRRVVDFLTSVDLVGAEAAGEDAPAGWVDRWLAGERPASRAEQREAKAKKKAKRKKSRR
ncbi:MAG: hypothetical protein H6736_08345 [Alphaproteobacteria bacterium]|nr:hypothetical protein [Alphaproteobacteria bacterium]